MGVRRNPRLVAGRAALLAGLVAAALALGPLAPAGARSAQAPTATGFAHGSARAFAIDPRAGGLSFGTQFGIATADQENAVARAYARAVALGLVGAAMGADACDGAESPYPEEDQPQPIRADSREDDAGTWHTEDGGIVYHEVRATPEPLAEARTTTTGYLVPGVLELGTAETVSRSGTGADGLRFSTAVTDIASLDFAGGLVHIAGARWEVTYRDQAEVPYEASFTLGPTTIAGAPVPESDSDAVLDLVHTALEPLGFTFDRPAVIETQDGVRIEPLVIGLVPNATRDSVAATAIALGSPAQQAAYEALLAIDHCTYSGYILVADLMVGSVTGAGALELTLGGVEASTRPGGAAADFSARLPVGAPSAVPPAAGAAPPVGATAAPPVAPGARPVTAPPIAAAGAAAAARPLAATTVPRDRAAAVAATSLLLGALLVEGDRRKMRRAQRLGDGLPEGTTIP